MSNTYSGMDIKNALGTTETLIGPSAFRYARFSADSAFSRLQIMREIKKMIIDGVNEYADDLPMDLRKQYDNIINSLKKIEEDEVELIRFGE